MHEGDGRIDDSKNGNRVKFRWKKKGMKSQSIPGRFYPANIMIAK